MAVTILAGELQGAVNGLDKADVAVADRLLAVVTALVEGEAPDAPSSIQNEASIRAAAWLFQSQTSIGQIELQRIGPMRRVRFELPAPGRLLAPWIERTI